MKNCAILVIIMLPLALAVGCDGGTQKNPVVVGQHLVDPSGNWKMSFTDTNANDLFILSIRPAHRDEAGMNKLQPRRV